MKNIKNKQSEFNIPSKYNKSIKSNTFVKPNNNVKSSKLIKNTFKKKIRNNNISSNNEICSNISPEERNLELELDNITDDENNEFYTKNSDNNIDFNLIKRLPISNNNKILFVSKPNDEDSDSDYENNLQNYNKDIDIDIENLTKDFISGKIIYYDYTKNIIYNNEFKIIGEINEDVEINLDDKLTDYDELEKSIYSNDLNIQSSEEEHESEDESEIYIN